MLENELDQSTTSREDERRLDSLLIKTSLLAEIESLKAEGYSVHFSPEIERTDAAYSNADSVVSMFGRLKIGGERYELGHRESLTLRELGAAKLVARLRQTPFRAIATPFLAASRRVNQAKEVTRRDILYSPDKMPWHNQSGQAVALLTIAFAHDLQSNQTGGKYRTMSALLGKEIFDTCFDERSSGFLIGKTLSQANITAQQLLFGKSLCRAQAVTKRRIKELHEFIDQPISEDFKQIVQYSTDSLGIRSRKDKLREIVCHYVDTRLEHGVKPATLTLLSVGCGTAIPIFELAKALKTKGISPLIILLDQDPVALAAAQCLAENEEFGLGDSIELHCRRLFSNAGKMLSLSPVIRGRKIDIVEDTGLREYLPPRVYVSLTRELWEALAVGGIMSTGNMNTHRPQPEFLHGLMGWEPMVRMRDIATSLALHEASGIEKGSTEAFVTPDGVYTLYISQKPKSICRNG